MSLSSSLLRAPVQGLGKTLTTIAFLHTYLSLPPADASCPRRVLIAVPANVLFNFCAEVRWHPAEALAWICSHA